MVLFMPFGVRVFARPMRYCSLARRSLSRLSLSFSNGVTVSVNKKVDKSGVAEHFCSQNIPPMTSLLLRFML